LKKWFWIDLVATVPWEMFVGAGGRAVKVVRLVRALKLIRVMKLSRIMGRITDGMNINPATYRLLQILLTLVYMWHCIGCIYWMVIRLESAEDTQWAPPDYVVHGGSLALKYTQGFFWAINTTLQVRTVQRRSFV
jgi:hypothetical protein